MRRYTYGYRYGFGYFYALRFVGKVAGIAFIAIVLAVLGLYGLVAGNGPATSSAPAVSTSTTSGGN